ncbi:acetyltransferase [Candidatus Roizmanbacteria bacterium RIFOXYC2_FULL_41_10]|nr:MAG: acetyltransferase [Candidatus Roizmanbacteria bacterium RIFOXYC2_FULL_41_10]
MIDSNVQLGRNVKIFNSDLVNIFGCVIGDDSFIGPFVEITRGVTIGRKCLIESHSFLCTSVELEDEVFIGHGVMFTNDLFPRTHRHVEYLPTVIKRGASIGSNATILCGLTVGEYAVVGAGAVVTKTIPALSICAGNPAKVLRKFSTYNEMFAYMQERQTTQA